MDEIIGKIYLLGDDINTDDIVPSHTLTMRDSIEMAKCTLIDPNFTKEVHENNIIIAGENFGSGSSREEAVNVFKILGVNAIIAKSFARIYFRNMINKGIPGITLKWDRTQFSKGDEIKIILHEGVILNRTKNKKIKFGKLPEFLTNILEEGGILNQLLKNLHED